MADSISDVSGSYRIEQNIASLVLFGVIGGPAGPPYHKKRSGSHHESRKRFYAAL
jgi:hypothetical protein